MEMSFSSQDEQFRGEVKDFIAEAFDDELRSACASTRNNYLPKDLQVRWHKRVYEKGWVAPSWPKDMGGTGWSVMEKYIYEQELAAVGAPHILPFGVRMCAPVIMKFGTEEQKEKYLPRMLNGDDWWCQGYSEPGSGSDLASLQMKAENMGDHYLVNGSKIWTSAAQHADMIFCLVRTSKEDKRQDGISFILVDMNTPGITVDAIATSDMPLDGFQEVNQVFFEDVKVPIKNRVGEEGKGWTYAKYLLEFERGNPYSSGLWAGLKKARKVASEQATDGSRLIDDSSYAAKLAAAEAQIAAVEITELRILSRLSGGQNMGPESSLMKCRGTELQMLLSELLLEAIGYYAAPFQATVFGSNEEPIGPDYASGIAPSYFNKRKVSIYAGSNEIQRNIMAKLILGL